MREGVGLVALGLLGTGCALVVLEVGVRSWSALVADGRPRRDRPAFFYAPERGSSLSDYPYPAAKPPGAFRIVVVGDSFTYPYGLQFDDAFPKRLERMLTLAEPGAGHLRAEVLNFGKIGVNAEDEVEIVGGALRYQPDLLLLEITLNDPPSAHDVPDWRMPEITEKTHPILFHWKTLVVVTDRLRVLRSRATVVQFHRQLFENPASWQRFADAISSMRTMCGEHHVAFAAVIFPMLQTAVDDRYPFAAAHERIAALIRSLGASVLDLRPAFAGIPPERLHLVDGGDQHPNEIAHRIAAEQIYLWLEREKLIPPELVLTRKYAWRGLYVRPLVPVETDAQRRGTALDPTSPLR